MHHQSSGFNQSGVYMLMVRSFHLVGVCFLEKQLRHVCQTFIIFQGTGSLVILLCSQLIV